MAGIAFDMKLTRQGKDFRRIDADASALLVNAQYSNAVDLQQTARKRARERTGRMKREIRIVKTGPLAYNIEAPTPYASFNEFGTTRMAAQPFLRPAVDEVRPRAEQRISNALKKAVE